MFCFRMQEFGRLLNEKNIIYKNDEIRTMADGKAEVRTMQDGGFEKIISLGYNCEVSFRIENYRGGVESYPFSWSYVLDQDSFGNALQRAIDGKLITGPYYVNQANMFLFSDCKCSFHSKAENKGELVNLDGSTNYEKAEIALEEIRARFQHLQEKFQKLFTGNESVLFIVKVQKRPIEIIKKNIYSIKDFFKNSGLKKWFLLAVLEETEWDETFEEMTDEHLAVDTVSCFAPDGDTRNGGPISEWLRLIDYYDHAFDRLIPNRRRRMSRNLFRAIDTEERSYAELKKWTDELYEGKQWLEQQYLNYRSLAEQREKEIEELRNTIERMKKEEK